MNKFKVGDKVRIISNDGPHTDNRHIGKICTISKVNLCNAYPYTLKEINYPWEEEGLERVDDMVEIVRKPIYKQAKVAKAIDEYINKGLHKGNIVEVIDRIYNSNDEGEIEEVKYGNIGIRKSGNLIKLDVASSESWVSKDKAIKLFTAGLEMCEGE